MEKNIYITRGVSGSGKSTFANSIKNMHPETVVCCADDFFMENGEYNFNVSKLTQAHDWCKSLFRNAVGKKVDTIIVSNTNTREWEWKYYEEYGKEYGYKVFNIILENRHGGENVHGVPSEILEKQKSNILEDIIL